MLRFVVVVAALFPLWLCNVGVAAGAAVDVLRALDGRWHGGGLALTIDAERGLARLDPSLPFQWEAFNIRNIEGAMVVFSIGERLFIGYLDGNVMRLTTPGRQGSWTLGRSRAR
jgi:hypothetical protein